MLSSVIHIGKLVRVVESQGRGNKSFLPLKQQNVLLLFSVQRSEDQYLMPRRPLYPEKGTEATFTIRISDTMSAYMKSSRVRWHTWQNMLYPSLHLPVESVESLDCYNHKKRTTPRMISYLQVRLECWKLALGMLLLISNSIQ